MAFGGRGPLPEDNVAPGRDARRDASTLLFGFDGRIGRVTYAWTFTVAALAWVWAPTLIDLSPLPESPSTDALRWVIVLPAGWVAAAVTAKRAHDAGLTGWLALGLGVPGARWLLALGLWAAPTEQAWNAYGRPPAKVRVLRR